MPKISLCMIAQDEEGCIAVGLENCQNYVDEIIILDGGSVDNTIEIARSYPKVMVYEHPFENHFARQKNRCMEYVTGEWLLWKDCDELYEDDALVNLQRLISTYPEFDAFAFARKNYLGGGLVNLTGHDYQTRFWKHGKGIHYEPEKHIHEGVIGFDNLMFLNMWIIHSKTYDMQMVDNRLYWDLGQEPPPGWTKQDGIWMNHELENS